MQNVYNVFEHFTKTEHFDKSERLAVGFQPISVPHMSASQQPGRGNIFGLDPSDGPLIFAFVELRWIDAAKDDRMENLMARMHAAFRNVLIQTDSYHSWVYPNYAARFQNPFSGLNKDTIRRLKAVRKAYDPSGVFARLQPGAFDFGQL